jgi:hypothetical protein
MQVSKLLGQVHVFRIENNIRAVVRLDPGKKFTTNYSHTGYDFWIDQGMTISPKVYMICNSFHDP